MVKTRHLGSCILLLAAACTPAPPPKAQFHAVAETAAPLDAAPADMALLNRVSWGAETADAQTLARQGIQTWLDRQLDPAAEDDLPPDAADQSAAMEISQKSL